jgi:hypothetical protein
VSEAVALTCPVAFAVYQTERMFERETMVRIAGDAPEHAGQEVS